MLSILRQNLALFGQKTQKLCAWHMPLLALAFVVLCISSFQVSAQSEIARSEAELKSLQKKIALVKRNIAKSREDESAVQLQLKKTEQQIAQLQETRLRSEAQLVTAKNEFNQLQEKLQQLELQKEDMQQKLSQVVRARYLLQDQNIIKLILNQEDPEAVSRSFIYYQHLARAGDRFLTQVNQQKQEVAAVSAELETRQRKISQSLAEIKQQENAINEKKTQRQAQLATIQTELKQNNKQFSSFERKEDELQLLLKQLHRSQQQRKQAEQAAAKAKRAAQEAARIAESSKQPDNKAQPSASQTQTFRRVSGDFATAKGRMSLPLNGQVKYRFGEKNQESGVSFTGVMLAAQEGQTVRSIHNGQIVYADWFRGYGQLIVIDHGQGYMSLYGHNQVLLANIGDVVEAGQQIARAGTTGGLTTPGLYFEIRVQGEPSDPLLWCRA